MNTPARLTKRMSKARLYQLCAELQDRLDDIRSVDDFWAELDQYQKLSEAGLFELDTLEAALKEVAKAAAHNGEFEQATLSAAHHLAYLTYQIGSRENLVVETGTASTDVEVKNE